MKNSKVIKNIALKFGAMKLCRQIFKNNTVAILRYHSIVSPEDNYYASPSICISLDKFEKQIRYISRNFQVISLDTVADCIQNNEDFPEKAVVITFDDGYKDNYNAYRVLKKYNITGTFYIAAGCIDNTSTLWLFEVIYLVSKTNQKLITIKLNNTNNTNNTKNTKNQNSGNRGQNTLRFPLENSKDRSLAIRRITEVIKSHDLIIREDIRSQLRAQTSDVIDLKEKSEKVMLSWNQVREMVQNGMSIGGHTMTHLNLPNAKEDDALREITECKALIQEKTGMPAHHFSYPNGGNYDYYNDSIIKMVKKSGYRTAATSNNGVAVFPCNPFELKRLRVTSNLAEILYQVDIEPVVNSIL